MSDLYVSVDIEANGPVPGLHSMLSFGCVAMDAEGFIHSTFSRNLGLLPEAGEHETTMAWWKTQPEAWAACREDPMDPERAMREHRDWLWQHSTGRRVVFVAYPLAFDFAFMAYYLVRFTGANPYGFTGLDLKTLAWGLLGGGPFHRSNKRSMPPEWKQGLPRHNLRTMRTNAEHSTAA
jgi:hypothetical protein